MKQTMHFVGVNMKPTNQPVDWTYERSQFPVTEKFAYFMNAATTPMNKSVHEVCQGYLDRLLLEGDLNWMIGAQGVEQARHSLAELLGGTSKDYAFGVNSNNNMGLLASAIKHKVGLGNIVYPQDEFPSSYVPWAYQGFELKPVKANLENKILISDILHQIDSNTRAVVVSAVQFSTGCRLHLQQLGNEIRQRGIFFIVNATQALGVVPIDLIASNVDAMVCSSHKWIGAGHGASVLYCTPEFRENIHWPLAGPMSFMDYSYKGSMEQKRIDTNFIESGSMPYMIALAIGASVKNTLRIGLENITHKILETSDYLVSELEAKGLKVISPRDSASIYETSRSGIVSLEINPLTETVEKLKAQNVLVNERRGLMRVSCHYFNDKTDVDRLIQAL
jgi:cysteine desulfurase/selenocysteine lyase